MRWTKSIWKRCGLDKLLAQKYLMTLTLILYKAVENTKLRMLSFRIRMGCMSWTMKHPLRGPRNCVLFRSSQQSHCRQKRTSSPRMLVFMLPRLGPLRLHLQPWAQQVRIRKSPETLKINFFPENLRISSSPPLITTLYIDLKIRLLILYYLITSFYTSAFNLEIYYLSTRRKSKSRVFFDRGVKHLGVSWHFRSSVALKNDFCPLWFYLESITLD